MGGRVSSLQGCGLCPAEDERSDALPGGAGHVDYREIDPIGKEDTVPKSAVVRVSGLSHWPSEQDGDSSRVATEIVLPSSLVHLSTTNLFSHTLSPALSRTRVSCNATPYALPRNDRRISTVLSWRDPSHFAPDLSPPLIFSRIPARVERGDLGIPAGHAGAREVAGTKCLCGKGMGHRGSEVSTLHVSRISN